MSNNFLAALRTCEIQDLSKLLESIVVTEKDHPITSPDEMVAFWEIILDALTVFESRTSIHKHFTSFKDVVATKSNLMFTSMTFAACSIPPRLEAESSPTYITPFLTTFCKTIHKLCASGTGGVRNRLQRKRAILECPVFKTCWVALARNARRSTYIHDVCDVLVSLNCYQPQVSNGLNEFVSAEVRDAFVVMSPCIKKPVALEAYFHALALLTDTSHERDTHGTSIPSKETFATPAMRDAILAAASKATTPECVARACQAITNITNGKCDSYEARKSLFATYRTRDVLVGMSQYATLDSALRWFMHVIVACCAGNGDSGPTTRREIFSCPTIYNAILSLGSGIGSQEAALGTCQAISAIVAYDDSRKLRFATKEICQMMVGMAKHFGNHKDTVDKWCSLLTMLAKVPAKDNPFTGEDIRDVMIQLCNDCKTCPQVRLDALLALVKPSTPTVDLYATPQMAAALIQTASLLSGPQHVRAFCHVLYVLTHQREDPNSEQRRSVFATPGIRDCYTNNIFPHATTDISFQWGCVSLLYLLTGSDKVNTIARKDLFTSPELRDAIYCQPLQTLVTTPATAQVVLSLLNVYTTGKDVNANARRSLMSQGVVRDNIIYLSSLCTPDRERISLYTTEILYHVVDTDSFSSMALWITEDLVFQLARLSRLVIHFTPETIKNYMRCIKKLLFAKTRWCYSRKDVGVLVMSDEMIEALTFLNSHEKSKSIVAAELAGSPFCCL